VKKGVSGRDVGFVDDVCEFDTIVIFKQFEHFDVGEKLGIAGHQETSGWD
jgi:hypothetical protein